MFHVCRAIHRVHAYEAYMLHGYNNFLPVDGIATVRQLPV